MDKRNFKCFDCNHAWDVEFGIQRPTECPKCKSKNFHRVKEEENNFYRHRRQQRSRHYEND